jgi:hypothetical protein
MWNPNMLHAGEPDRAGDRRCTPFLHTVVPAPDRPADALI